MSAILRMTEAEVTAHQHRMKLVAGPELQAQAEALRAQQPEVGHADFLRNKYRAQPLYADGHRFSSKKEYCAYQSLKLREKAGEIEGLRLQVRFALFDPGDNCRGELLGRYTSDFVWKEGGKLVVADVKSRFTAKLREWPRTKKLMLMCHGISMVEL